MADLVISDVEMPQIDGLHLTRRIKEHPQLNVLPVLLYSSILTPDNFKKGQSVGTSATDQARTQSRGRSCRSAADRSRSTNSHTGLADCRT